MNLDEEARLEARRIEIRPDSSYFFPFSFFFSLLSHSLSITFSGIAETIQRAWWPDFLRGVEFTRLSFFPFEYRLNWFYQLLLVENLFFELIGSN